MSSARLSKHSQNRRVALCIYSSRSRPWAFSVIASSIRKSNLPACASSSICRSHCSQSRSTNHCRKRAYSSGASAAIAVCSSSTRDMMTTLYVLLRSNTGHESRPKVEIDDNISDIEQPLTVGNLIKPANGFPKQAKDFNLHVVETYNEVLELALHRHADAMNPFQELEHPTQGGSLGWLVDLVGERLVLTSQLLAQSALRHRIDQQR